MESSNNHKRNKKQWGKDNKPWKKQKNSEFIAIDIPFSEENKKPKETQDYENMVFKMGSEKFDKYYQTQFPWMDEAEFKEFTSTLQEKLPVTYRVNQTEVNHETVSDLFTDKHFIEKYFQETIEAADLNQEDLKNKALDMTQIKLENKKYYPPGNVLFELTVPRELLKKNVGLKEIHKLIQKANDSGILTRQEIVSMLPPLLLGVEAEHAVFDMCAAPGSKTAQIFELMMTSQVYNRQRANTQQSKGFIVANDADSKRAFMLTHQMNRLNTSNMVILNHNAQNFPNLCYQPQHAQTHADTRVLFDRIVCDVPCSSDAAIRKIPQKWEKWSTQDGAALHVLQSRILFKGLQLLKVGGKISYSTCSLNPIEDEAVVASALKQFAGCIEVEEVSLPGFKFRQGMPDWRVMTEKLDKASEDDYFHEFANFSDVSVDYMRKRCLKETMFPSFYDEETRKQLTKCLRVLPHDQNTSGFFITIIRKTKDFDFNADQQVITRPLQPVQKQQEEQKHQLQNLGEQKTDQVQPKSTLPLIIQKKNREHTFEFTRCDANDPDIQYLQAYYGLSADFPVDQLITQSDEMKKLYFISPELSKFLYADSNSHHLNIINMGVALFHRNSSKYSSNSECIFRISQDGLLNLIPYMSKRLVFVSTMDQFKFFLMNKNIEVDTISEEGNLRKQIDDMTTGCFILAVKIQETLVEGIVMHKFPKSVNMMVSRENIFSLHLRYLTKAQRESVAVAFELDK